MYRITFHIFTINISKKSVCFPKAAGPILDRPNHSYYAFHKAVVCREHKADDKIYHKFEELDEHYFVNNHLRIGTILFGILGRILCFKFPIKLISKGGFIGND
jgi:hypothetical protein